jgi:8-oxo-dGTP pyrophosphatase MutT (NUDIX family)
MVERWRPNVTVAAVIEREGRFLLVEEQTAHGLRLNNPAGHLDPGETLVEACVREVAEETTHVFEPTHLVGVYLTEPASSGITYLRFAFCGKLGAAQADRSLDAGIERTLWMTPQEIRSSAARHRSPVLLCCVENYLAGARFPLTLLRP